MICPNNKVRFVTINLYPFYIPVKVGNSYQIEGVGKHLYKLISQAMNCSYELILSNEVGYGFEISPGNWTGPIGMLHRQEGDILSGQYGAEPHLFKFLGFSNSFDTTPFSVLSGPNSASSPKSPSMFSSIDAGLWVCLGITWFVISLFFTLFSLIEKKYLDPNTPKENLLESLVTFYGLLFQRGFGNLPKTQSRRILVTGWLILVVVLMIDMAGSFSSRLAVTDQPIRIDRVEDIIKFPQLRPYISQGVVADLYIEQSDKPEHQALWKQVQKFNGHKNSDEFFQTPMMDEISRGEAVAIANQEGYLAYMVSIDCPVFYRPYYVAKEPFMYTSVIVLHRKGLDPDVLESLNINVLHYGAMGFSRGLWIESGRRAEPCLKVTESRVTYKPSVLRDMEQVFRVLWMGITASVVTFTVEMVFSFSIKKNEGVEF